ncbi:MAG TPA: protein kinase [Solirubrobacterales bacterium]|jgi:serine/threonine protein kinase|nr:protein kinase [Solirubrobacterales bacterium]
MPGKTKKKKIAPSPTGESRYRFGEHIGAGGMGTVRRADRLDENGDVVDDKLAVKHLAPKYVTSPEAVRRFKREVRLQRRLDHVNVVPVYGRNLSALPPWFTMPLADGNLDEEIARRTHRDRDWVLDTTRQILAGVAHAHDRNVVHRDLKPKNVLRFGEIWKVSDFGLGKDLDPDATHLTRTTQHMGTEAFMAPEQFDEPKNVHKPADIYAIGKIVCQLSTGRRPPIRTFELTDVHRDFHYFVSRCCDDDPSRRYADAREALEALDALVDEDDADPAQVAQALMRDVHLAVRDLDVEEVPVDALASHMLRYGDEEEMYLEVVPRMPREVVRAFLEVDPAGFARVLGEYDKHIEGGLPFDYCDTVARFYRAAWNETDDLQLRELILRRLIVMGAGHNRWFVREVVAELLAGVDDKATAMMAAEVIDSEAADAAWHAEEALEAKPTRTIAKALRRAKD